MGVCDFGGGDDDRRGGVRRQVGACRLSDLRAELDEAIKRAEGERLKVELEQVTVSLDVAFTVGKKGEGSAEAGAKFWVFASAEGGVKGELSSQRVDTQL